MHTPPIAPAPPVPPPPAEPGVPARVVLSALVGLAIALAAACVPAGAARGAAPAVGPAAPASESATPGRPAFAACCTPTSGCFLRVERVFGWPLGVRPLQPAELAATAHVCIDVRLDGWALTTRNARGVILESEYGAQAAGGGLDVRTFGRFGQPLTVERYEAAAQAGGAAYRLTAPSGQNGLSPCRALRQWRDRAGLVVRQDCVDENGGLIPDERGVVRTRFEWSPEPLLTAIRYFEAAGHPVRVPAGYAALRREYGPTGCLAATHFLAASGAPESDIRGVAVQRDVHSALCVLLESAVFDAAGQPVVARDGVHRTVWRDDSGLPVRTAYFDTVGLPMRHPALRAHLLRRQYNAQGDVVSLRYFDEHEAAVTGPDGYHMRHATYDSEGRLIQERYFDTHEVPQSDFDEVHGRVYEPDAFGRPAAVRYLDTLGEPTRDRRDQVFGVRYEYDARQRLNRRTFVDADGAATARWSGDFAIEHVYDAAGREIERRTLDAAGAPRRSADGSTHRLFEYDSRDRLVSVRFYRGDVPAVVAPSSTVSGFHRVQRQFDGLGRVVELRYFGPADEAVAARFRRRGPERPFDIEAHRVVIRRDVGTGRPREQLLFARDAEKAFALRRCEAEDCVAPSGLALVPPAP